MNSQDKEYGTFNPFSMETSARVRNVSLKVTLDVLLLSIFAAFLALFYDYLTPFKRGFFCDDENIMYPQRLETISDQKLWCTSVLVPVALIVLTEAYRHFRSSDTEVANDIHFLGWKIPHSIQRTYSYTGIFLFGIIMSEIAANYIKLLVGRLRPSFMESCRPDFNCSDIGYSHFFVKSFSCTNPELDDENDLRKSFPSGHSSVSTYAMLYAVLYLQSRLEVINSSLIKPLMQLLLLFLGAFISLSRLQDNKHHWDDIFAGFLLGSTICLVMVFSQTDLFQKYTGKKEEASSKGFQP